MGCRSLTCCNFQFHSTTFLPTSPTPFSISFSHPQLSTYNHNGIPLRLRSATSTSKVRAKFEKFQGEPSQEAESSFSLETITTDTPVNSNEEDDRYYHFTNFEFYVGCLCMCLVYYIPIGKKDLLTFLLSVFQLLTSGLGGCSDTIKSGCCIICIFRRDQSNSMFQYFNQFLFFHTLEKFSLMVPYSRKSLCKFMNVYRKEKLNKKVYGKIETSKLFLTYMRLLF